MNTFTRHTILALVAFLSLTLKAGAVAKNWIGAANGSFNVAANWSPSGVPGSADDVTIALTAASTITMSAPATINSLVFTISGNNNVGRLDVGGNTFTILGTSSINVTSGNNNTIIEIGTNGGTSAGVVDFQGAVSLGTTATSRANFMGNTNSKLIFRSNLTLGEFIVLNEGGVDVKLILVDLLGRQRGIAGDLRSGNMLRVGKNLEQGSYFLQALDKTGGRKVLKILKL